MKAPVRIAEAELLHLAAMGERSAQARLASACIARQFVGVTPFEAMVMAEGFARLAACHGHIEDTLTLAGVLRVRAHHVAELGDTGRALALLGQSEALCDDLTAVPLCEGTEFLSGVLTTEADAGDELAAIRLGKRWGAMSAGDADNLRSSVNDACRERDKAEALAND
jgi:hypothetical protein